MLGECPTVVMNMAIGGGGGGIAVSCVVSRRLVVCCWRVGQLCKSETAWLAVSEIGGVVKAGRGCRRRLRRAL